MTDRAKVIQGLEILMNGCGNIDCDDCCFYISTKPTRCGLREEQIQEDALALLKEQETANLYKCPNCGTWVSAENVVLCKDCKHKEESVSPSWEAWCNRLHCGCDNDWFCADGERK